MISGNPGTLALVPVLVNGGVAILPAVGAALLSVLGVLLRPKVLLGGLLAAAVIVTAGMLWPAAPEGPQRRAASGVRSADEWFDFAVAYRRDRQAALGLVTVGAESNRAPASTRRSDVHRDDASSAEALIFRLDSRRSGYGGGPSPVDLAPAWSWRDPDDPFAMYPATVAVKDGWVYGASVSLSPPDSLGAVFCLGAETGQLRWLRFETPPAGTGSEEGEAFKGIFSSPALTADGRYLVVGQGLHYDRNSELLCFRARTGKLHWRVPTPLHIEGSPAIEGDLVVAGAGAVEVGEEHRITPGDNPGFVLCVRISDGKTLWKHSVNDPESSPVLEDGVAYIGSGINGNAVVALRTEMDEELVAAGLKREIWRSPTPWPASGAVTVTDELVLIGCATGNFVRPGDEGVVLALDRATGKERWRTTPEVVSGAVFAPVAVRGGLGIVAVGNGDVVAIDLTDRGELIWKTRPNGEVPILAGAAYTGDHVYVVSSDGRLAVLDAGDGRKIEDVYLNAPGRPGEMRLSISAPVVLDGRLYVGSETGGVHCFKGKGRR